MNPILRNILAVVAGAVFGSVVNMSIIMSSPGIIPPPAGVDVSDIESLKENLHLFEPKHFLLPFLAHALGTFSGAFMTALLAASHKFKLALLIGFLFLAGGTANLCMLPSPLWFSILDLTVAYIPMAYLGWRVTVRVKNSDSLLP